MFKLPADLAFAVTYDIPHRLNARVEKLIIAIVWRLPRRVVMWAAIRLMAHATVGQWGNEHPDSVSIMAALKRWDIPHEQ